MVTNGYPWSSSRKTEILDLANGLTRLTCSGLAGEFVNKQQCKKATRVQVELSFR